MTSQQSPVLGAPRGKRALILLAALAILAMLATFAVRSFRDDDAAPPGFDRVIYLTSFGLSGRESYVHTAIKKGFFAAERIDVQVKPGAAGPSNESQVISGQATFATVDSSGAMERFGRDPRRTIRAVAVVHQETLLSIVTLDDRKITTADQLVGKTIGSGPRAAPQVIFPVYAQQPGPGRLTRDQISKVKWRETQPSSLTQLLINNQVDGIGLFVAGVPVVEAAERKAAQEQERVARKVVVLPYSDRLEGLIGNILITSADTAARNPDLVRRFTRALMAGLRYAVEHPNESGKIFADFYASRKDQKQVFDSVIAADELKMMRPYVEPRAGRPYGGVEPSTVAKVIALLQNTGVPAFSPDQLFVFPLVPGGTA